MSLLDVVVTAVTSMRTNIMRTLLTMLGIIIGIGAVITLTAATEGSKKGVTDRVRGLGSDLMFVKPYSKDSGGVNIPGLGPSLFWEDSKQVQAANDPDVEAVAAMGFVGAPGDLIKAQIIYRGQNMSTLLVGTEPSYQQVRNFYVESGRFVSQDDLDKKALNVVLGRAVADRLFGSSDPIGESVRIFAGVSSRFGIGFNFTVIGVMEPRGGGANSDEDNQIFVPLPSFQARLPQGFRNARGYTNINQINIKLAPGANEDAVKLDVAGIMRRSRNIQVGADDDFQIQSQKDVLSAATEVENSFQALVVSIALIALVVGGIGIMNIMLVSVTERTREIGIRKAVGARRFDILLQFLIEALIVTIIGGIIGVVAGWGVSRGLEHDFSFGVPLNFLVWDFSFDVDVSKKNYVLTPVWVIVGLAVSAVTGIVAGVYPAWRASRLDPIEALRHE